MVTVEAACYLSSPVHISAQKTGLIPYIRLNDQIYIVKEKVFYEILDKINLYQDFNLFIRENGYSKTGKWLNKRGLLTPDFLDGVSYYNIEVLNFKKINNYSPFQKDCNFNPHISGEYLKNLFKKVFIYKYLKEKTVDFNNHVEKKLKIVNQELSSIKVKANYVNRKNFYKKNLFNIILEDYLINIENSLLLNLQTIENANIYTESYLTADDLVLSKVGNPISLSDFKYKIINITYQECLKSDVSFKLFFNVKNSINKDSFLLSLLENIKILTKDKFSFDKQFISAFSINDRKNINNKLEFEYINNQKESVLLKEKKDKYQLPDLINTNINAVKNSDFLFCSNESVNKIITILNLNEDNIEKINFMFSDKNKIELDLINLAVENEIIPYYEICNYGNIYYN